AKVPIESYVATFQEKVRVELTTPAGAQVWGTISAIRLVDGNIANQGYDVMVLRVQDAAFAAAVRGVASPNGQPNPFPAEGWRKGGPGIFELREAYGARSVLLNGQAYPGPPQVEDDANWNLLQFGYGRISATGNFAFGYRARPIAALTKPLYIDETHDH